MNSRLMLLERKPPGDFLPYLITTFSWHRFLAISLWILVLFLIHVTATEFGRLFGPAEIRRLFLTSRPSELQLNRRQRARELLRFSRLADAIRPTHSAIPRARHTTNWSRSSSARRDTPAPSAASRQAKFHHARLPCRAQNRRNPNDDEPESDSGREG
jgi:hypothetical protein